MSTEDEIRREVAAKLRGITAIYFDDGEFVDKNHVFEALGLEQDGDFVVRSHVEELADLIDRPTCRNTPYGYKTEFECSSCGRMHDFGYGFNYCPGCGAEVER